jgi:uncharacterized membrane protein
LITKAPNTARPGQFITAGMLLGVGLGGFIDGIVFHQILQWHHMLTSTDSDNIGLRSYPATTVRGLEVNTLWDGLFHASSWVFVAVGLALLWRAWQHAQVPPAGRSLVGLLGAGWGLFNLVEGVINHHLLGIHHVRSGENELLFDLGFLALGAVLLVGGWTLYRAGLVEPNRVPGDARSARP